MAIAKITTAARANAASKVGSFATEEGLHLQTPVQACAAMASGPIRSNATMETPTTAMAAALLVSWRTDSCVPAAAQQAPMFASRPAEMECAMGQTSATMGTQCREMDARIVS